MKAKVAIALVVGAISVPAATEAQVARPIRFWLNVTDFGARGAMRVLAWTPGATVTSSLQGWTCKLGPIELRKHDAVAPAPGFAGWPASMGQSADVVCTSVAGSVKATAACTLQSTEEFDHAELKITDAAGHSVWLNAACRND